MLGATPVSSLSEKTHKLDEKSPIISNHPAKTLKKVLNSANTLEHPATHKYGNERYKSKRQQAAGRKKGTFRDKWSKAMKSARRELVKEGLIGEDSGFVPVGGKTKEGKALLERTRKHMVDTIAKMKIV